MTSLSFWERQAQIHYGQIDHLSEDVAVNLNKDVVDVVEILEDRNMKAHRHHIDRWKNPPVAPPLPDWAQKIKDTGFIEHRVNDKTFSDEEISIILKRVELRINPTRQILKEHGVTWQQFLTWRKHFKKAK